MKKMGWYEYYLKNMNEYSLRPQYDNYSSSLLKRQISLDKVLDWDKARKKWLTNKIQELKSKTN
jgi:hypothetical protein